MNGNVRVLAGAACVPRRVARVAAARMSTAPPTKTADEIAAEERAKEIKQASDALKLQQQLSHVARVATPVAARPEFEAPELVKTDPLPSGSLAVLTHLPETQRARRMRIYRSKKTSMQAGTSSEIPWRIDATDAIATWENPLMGWRSGRDSLRVSGLFKLKFDSADDALEYCRKMGWHGEVEEWVEMEDLTGGKKDYGRNFLNEHVQNYIRVLPPKRIARTQFAHSTKLSSCWVNLKHTPWGKIESKVCTGTQWSNEGVSQHSAKDTVLKSASVKAELKRKLGK